MMTKEFQHKRKSSRWGLTWALMIPVFGIMALVTSQAQADDLAEKGTTLARKYCFDCHGGESSKGDEDFDVLNHKSLTEHASEYVIKDDLENSYMWMRIEDGEMPPRKAPQPTEEEVAIFKAWITAGSPIFTSTDAPATDAPATKAATTTPAEMPAAQRGAQQQGSQQPGLPPAPFGNEPTLKAAATEPGAALPGNIDIAVEGKRILMEHCAKCHPGEGTNDFDPRDLAKMVSSSQNILVPNHPEKSVIWERAGIDQDMPPKSKIRRGEAKALSPQDRELMRQWILAGAPYPEATPRGPYFSQANIWDLAYQDLRKINKVKRPYIRYFSLDNVYNNYIRYSNDEFVAHQAALSKVCNSLSLEPGIVPPYSVDEAGVLWRIDLRDYGWDELAFDGCNIPRYSAWKLLISQYPYGLSFGDQRFGELYDNYSGVLDMSKSSMPIIRGDWFCFNSTQGELYYLITQTPKTDFLLEERIGVDVRRDFEKYNLKRAALTRSGVSVSNRLMDRHRSRDGYYWKSYDFAINAGNNILVKLPLGPTFKGHHNPHPFPKLAFDQDGGEMIYSLPNGLQGYMLTTGAGERLEEGPAEVVNDSGMTNGTSFVANAISCMHCHANGMRTFKDDIRDNIAVFGGQQKAIVDELFASQDEMDQLMLRDSRTFRRACMDCWEDLDLTEKQLSRFFAPETEPVYIVAKRYWEPLNAVDVGFEIGIVQAGRHDVVGQEVMSRLKGNFRLMGEGMSPLDNPNGIIMREAWNDLDFLGDQSLFQETCAAFNIASGLDCSTSDAKAIFDAYKVKKELKYQGSGYGH